MKKKIYSPFIRIVCGLLSASAMLAVFTELYYILNQEDHINYFSIIAIAYGSYLFSFTAITGKSPFKYVDDNIFKSSTKTHDKDKNNNI